MANGAGRSTLSDWHEDSQKYAFGRIGIERFESRDYLEIYKRPRDAQNQLSQQESCIADKPSPTAASFRRKSRTRVLLLLYRPALPFRRPVSWKLVARFRYARGPAPTGTVASSTPPPAARSKCWAGPRRRAGFPKVEAQLLVRYPTIAARPGLSPRKSRCSESVLPQPGRQRSHSACQGKSHRKRNEAGLGRRDLITTTSVSTWIT